jgi:hypothetical protein
MRRTLLLLSILCGLALLFGPPLYAQVVGGGGGGGGIRVKEQDGAPNVAVVSEIRVTNDTLTDETGGVVSITTGGSMGPGLPPSIPGVVNHGADPNDWIDPASDSAGLQEIIDDPNYCPLAGCLINLAPGTYNVTLDPTTMSANEGAIEIISRNNIFINGSGRENTIINWIQDWDSAGISRAAMFKIGGGRGAGDAIDPNEPSRDILIHNMTIHMQSTCVPVTGVTNCGAAITPATIKILEAEGVSIVGNNMICDAKKGDGSQTFGCRVVWAQGDIWRGATNGGSVPSKHVWGKSNRIYGANRGWEMHFCDDCWITTSFLGSPNALDSTVHNTTGGMALKYIGAGTRITNNTFDMTGCDGNAGALNGCWATRQLAMVDSHRDGEAGAHVIVSDNHFINITSDLGSTLAIINMDGYNHGVFSNNHFQCSDFNGATCKLAAGDADGASCDSDLDCTAPEYCLDPDPCLTVGVLFNNNLSCTGDRQSPSRVGCNVGNVFSNNIFYRFRGDGWGGGLRACPFSFIGGKLGGGTPTDLDDPNNSSVRNIFTGNVTDIEHPSGVTYGFWDGSTQEIPGFCGDEATYGGNTIDGNIVSSYAGANGTPWQGEAQPPTCVNVQTPSALTNLPIFSAYQRARVRKVGCVARGGGTIAATYQNCDADGTGCTNLRAAVTCSSTFSWSANDLTDAEQVIEEEQLVEVDFGTASGTVDSAMVCIQHFE